MKIAISMQALDIVCGCTGEQKKNSQIAKGLGRLAQRKETLLELINPQTSSDQIVSCQLCVVKRASLSPDENLEDEGATKFEGLSPGWALN